MTDRKQYHPSSAGPDRLNLATPGPIALPHVKEVKAQLRAANQPIGNSDDPTIGRQYKFSKDCGIPVEFYQSTH